MPFPGWVDEIASVSCEPVMILLLCLQQNPAPYAHGDGEPIFKWVLFLWKKVAVRQQRVSVKVYDTLLYDVLLCDTLRKCLA